MNNKAEIAILKGQVWCLRDEIKEVKHIQYEQFIFYSRIIATILDKLKMEDEVKNIAEVKKFGETLL